MALHLYRRHRSKCKDHPPGSFSSEGEERKKGWKKCFCPIVASGVFPDGEFRRRSTEEWEWDKAEAQRKAWETTAPPPAPAPPTPPGTSTGEVKIEHAVRLFLEDQKNRGNALGTLRRYSWVMCRFEDYSRQHGLTVVDQWTKPCVRDFSACLNHGIASTQKNISILSGFFWFCEDNEWITRNPARMRRLRNRATSANARQRLPYTNVELERMYVGCLDWKGSKWNGQDLADFIAIAVHTGLRRCDIAAFHISRLNPETGELEIRTTKYGVKVNTWIPDWLVARIEKRGATVGSYIFGERTTTDPSVIGHTWYRRLKQLWKSCGPWKEKPNVHRFRHTFIRILLQDGHSPAFVAELAGDTEATIRKHYSAWVKERQDAVTKALRGSFADVPRPQYEDSGRVIAFEKKPRSA